MEPGDPERLSRDEFVEQIRRRQEELAEREAAIERRDATIRDLEVELAQFGRAVRLDTNAGRSARRPSTGGVT